MQLHLRKLLPVTALCIALTGCDPGMTIHESKKTSVVQLNAAPEGCGLELHASDSHRLIGENWYYTELTVTNLGDVPVAIDRIELVSQGVTYGLTDKRELAVPAHAT